MLDVINLLINQLINEPTSKQIDAQTQNQNNGLSEVRDVKNEVF